MMLRCKDAPVSSLGMMIGMIGMMLRCKDTPVSSLGMGYTFSRTYIPTCCNPPHRNGSVMLPPTPLHFRGACMHAAVVPPPPRSNIGHSHCGSTNNFYFAAMGGPKATS